MISRSDSPAALIKELRANGFRVYAEDDKLHVIPTHKLLPWVRDTIARNKWELMTYLLREQHRQEVKAFEEIVREAGEDLEMLRLELKYANQRNSLLRLQVDCLEIAQRALRTSKPALVLDDNLLRQAIGLTHPDRHGNSQVANEVTAALIKLRDQQREASRYA